MLPALGYSDEDLRQLAATIAAAPADVVVVGTPIDLARLLAIDKPLVRARYAFSEAEPGALTARIDDFLRTVGSPGNGQ